MELTDSEDLRKETKTYTNRFISKTCSPYTVHSKNNIFFFPGRFFILSPLCFFLTNKVFSSSKHHASLLSQFNLYATMTLSIITHFNLMPLLFVLFNMAPSKSLMDFSNNVWRFVSSIYLGLFSLAFR